ncbi:MAG TPA: AMP-binding protein, partial [Longimicrobiaceae bacterium]|nr:AMP-binding protein [Longimicrobiaceae bacterium]
MPATLPDFVFAAARVHPDRIAVAGESPVTYAELERAILGIARVLGERGVGGTRVGLLLPNVPEFPAAFFGALHAGASVVLLNPLYSPREVREYLGGAGARIVLTTAALQPLLPADAEAVLVEDVAAAAPGGGAPVDGPARLPTVHEVSRAEAVVIYTSAMDGWARGARLTHRNLAANLLGTIEAMQVGPGDRVIALLPLIHAFGLTVTLNAPLSQGASVIPVERFHPVRLLDLLESSGATVLCGVPAMYTALLSAAERRGAPTHALRLALCGGAPLPDGVPARWEALFGLPLREGYGITEASPVCLFNRMDRPNRAGTMGVPFPGVDVTLRDAGGQPVPRGEPGEICVAGANVFARYVGDAGRDAAVFHGDAFRTGDLGVADDDGSVRFLRCLKEMFTRSGFNIYPRELERVVAEDPRIARAVVTAVPDAAKENEIALSVVPAPGAELDEEAVRQI